MKVSENEIRPQDIFNEYLKLATVDVENYFFKSPFTKINCPACGEKGDFYLHKKGFNYDKCSNCFTIYVNPRPDKESFDRYYTDSPSTKFWATNFYKKTEQARREKLWKPKSKLVLDLINSEVKNSDVVEYVIDIGGGYGIFAEEFSKLSVIKPIIIEPSVHLSEICRKKGLEVIQKFIEDIKPEELPADKKCFVSFELFEHLHDPGVFLDQVYSLMEEKDLFIFTTLSGTGVDIQVLKEHSKSISPPHHLNFFNPQSVEILAKKVGFKKASVITPGKLDLDIMKNNMHHIKDEFWRLFLQQASEQEMQIMQEAIQSSRTSSHMMAILIK
jgi:hypothetical protein